MAEFKLRVYYEDTDAGGVVYYANYLKFAERARTEMLRELGVQQQELLDVQGIAFVVRHAELDLKAPARLDDELTVHTAIDDLRTASLVMRQRVTCGKDGGEHELCLITVKIACVNKQFKPTPLSKDLLEKFEKSL